MTRETKIGLLVGLMFIIVIGVLLSDHLTSANEPKMADMTGVGDKAFTTIRSPGDGNKYITNVTPQDIAPTAPVPSVAETQPVPPTLTPPTAPVTSMDVTRDALRGTSPFGPDGGSTLTLGDPSRSGTGTSAVTLLPPAAAVGPAVAVADPVRPAAREYKAAAGDTVSKMAAKFYGRNTQQNRDLIINANPSLKADPARVVVGRAYVIPNLPQPGTPVATAAGSTTRPVGLAASAASATPAAPRIYVVRSGDNLWRIASEQCHDSRAVDAILKLNSDQLKSSKQQLQIGMKLKLP